MFTEPRVNVIESDEGFSVQVLGRTGLLYSEGIKSVHIDSEVLLGPSGLIVFKDSFRLWNSPFENEPIDEGKRKAIIENIRRAFRFQGFEIQVA
jgi:hypothetical protein